MRRRPEDSSPCMQSFVAYRYGSGPDETPRGRTNVGLDNRLKPKEHDETGDTSRRCQRGGRSHLHCFTRSQPGDPLDRQYKVWVFALSAFFIGTSGAIYGYSLTHLRPLTFFAIAVAARMILMSIIGGRGTVAGPVVGAVLIIGVNEFAVRQFGQTELNIVFTGAILVAALLFFPQGIVGSLRNAGRLPASLDWD